ncbi:hypothetical protein CDAR_428381 [Caerostris darwini]|uniref:Uncharacterized protein n=1 Tax=Caerostris darwini TaxID=1538125 RepID=A0AAV4PEP9_9ARAC|nr:hypothetical protein CDAR_428381 [Caerostris darwini]
MNTCSTVSLVTAGHSKEEDIPHDCLMHLYQRHQVKDSFYHYRTGETAGQFCCTPRQKSRQHTLLSLHKQSMSDPRGTRWRNCQQRKRKGTHASVGEKAFLFPSKRDLPVVVLLFSIQGVPLIIRCVYVYTYSKLFRKASFIIAFVKARIRQVLPVASSPTTKI